MKRWKGYVNAISRVFKILLDIRKVIYIINDLELLGSIYRRFSQQRNTLSVDTVLLNVVCLSTFEKMDYYYPMSTVS